MRKFLDNLKVIILTLLVLAGVGLFVVLFLMNELGAL